jgi:hypothetical protein
MGLDDTVERLHDEAAEQQAMRIKLEAQLTAAAQRLGEKHRLMAEVSAIRSTAGGTISAVKAFSTRVMQFTWSPEHGTKHVRGGKGGISLSMLHALVLESFKHKPFVVRQRWM